MPFGNNFFSKQISLHLKKITTAGFPIHISYVGSPWTALISTQLFFFFLDKL